MAPLTPLDDALAAYAAELRPLPAETISTLDALDRVLAASTAYADDLPRFDQSAMDGYALRAADVAVATAGHPLRLRLAGTIAAGTQEHRGTLAPMSAARIFTGAPLPPGADTMIPQERATLEGETLVFTAPWPAERNIRRRGEEARAGQPLAAAGQRIGPGLLAALVNAGVAQVSVRRRPRIRLLVTGDELRPLGSPLRSGEIIDSNGPLVRSMLTRWGYPPPTAEHVRDEPEAVRAALAPALDEADLVLTCGGASVGERDYLVATAERLNVRRVFWKIAQRPGKPLYFGVRADAGRSTALFCLPGNPGAVLVGLLLHARRALDLLEGVSDPLPHWHPARLAAPVKCDGRRESLLRMRLDYTDAGIPTLRPLPQQDSHMLGNLRHADVVVRVPAGQADCPAGTSLRWTALF